MYKQQQKSWLDEHKGVLILSAIFLAALAFGGWGAWQVFGPVSGDPRSQLASARREGARLQDESEPQNAARQPDAEEREDGVRKGMLPEQHAVARVGD